MIKKWKQGLCFAMAISMLAMFLPSCAPKSPPIQMTSVSDPALTKVTSSYQNLDLSKLTVEPLQAEEVYDLTCTYDFSRTDSKEIMERFQLKVKEHYGLTELDETAIYCGCWIEDGRKTNWVPYADIKDTLDQNEIIFVKYEDAEHFFLFYVYAMAEWSNIPLLQKQIGLTDYNDLGWTPYDLHESIGSVDPVAVYQGADLDSTEISYPVVDGDMTLKEASDLIRKQLTPGFCELPDFLALRLTSLMVFPIGENTYGYWGDSTFYYKGITLLDAPGGGILASTDDRFSEDMTAKDGKYHSLYPSNAYTFVLSHDGLAWAWLSNTFDRYQVNNTYSEILSLEDALDQVSYTIADEFTPEILSAKLVYATEQIYENKDGERNGESYDVHLFPAWQMTVGEIGTNEYDQMTIYVDALTGAVTFYGCY